MKRRNLMRYAAAAAFISAVTVAGVDTVAYFTGSSTKVNWFTTGDLDLGLREPEWEPDEEDGKNMYPGYTVYKNPTVKNITSAKNGEEPCYCRINVEILDKNDREVTGKDALHLIYKTIYFDPSFTGTYDSRDGTAEGMVEGRIPGYNLAELSKYPMINPLWTKDTVRSTPSKLVFNYTGKDGDGILDIGEESTLFTNIVIPTDWNQTHLTVMGDYKLKITAQAIQCSGFAGQEDAYKILDEEINGGTYEKI